MPNDTNCAYFKRMLIYLDYMFPKGKPIEYTATNKFRENNSYF